MAPRKSPWVWVVTLVLASIATRAAFFWVGVTNVDEAAHLVGARELLGDGRLYVDFADNKPPALYFFYALAGLFGAGVGPVRAAFALAWMPATALAVAAFFDFDRRGRAAALALVVALAAALPSDAHAVNGEHVLQLLLAVAVALGRTPEALARPGRAAAIGALVGLAALAKQPAALCLAAPAVVLLFAGETRARRAGAIAALAAGFAFVMAVAYAIFAWRGTAGAFVFWVLRYNLQHVQNPMTVADRAARALKMGSVLIPSLGPLLAGAWLGRRSLDPHRRRWIAALAVTTFLPALLGWRLFGHYFIPLTFALALGAGPFFARVTEPGARRAPLAAALVLVVGAIAFTAGGLVVHDPRRGLADVSDPRYAQIGAALAPQCGGARPLFVWGYAPSIYVASGLRPASRFVVPIDTITGHLAGNDAFDRGAIDTRDRIVPEHWDWLMDDLERNAPEYVVDTAPANLNGWGRQPMSDFPRLDAFVRASYRIEREVGGAVIWRRPCAITASR